MKIEIGTLVTLPGFTPYPRYGRVLEIRETSEAVVGNVFCGDPRCSAEHAHGQQAWPTDELEAANAYQPQASWERGRRAAPNAPVV